MSLLHNYSQHLRSGDADSIALLFTEDGEFHDQAPTKLALQPVDVKGRENIRAFFRVVFRQGGLKVSNIAINGNAIRYDLEIGNTVFLCLGVATVENNLIKEYKVIAA